MKKLKFFGFFALLISGVFLLNSISNNPTDSLAGSGTANDPYTISTYDDLLKMGETANNTKNFILLNDLEITSSHTAMAVFKGTLDGNGYSIIFKSSLSNRSVGIYKAYGLFSELDGATIKNLVLFYEGPTLTLGNPGGNISLGLIAGVTSSGGSPCTFTNIEVYGSISMSSSVISAFGSIIGFGFANAHTYENVNSKLTMSISGSGSSTRAGGLAARSNNSTLLNSSYDANISITISGSGEHVGAGGLISTALNTNVVRNSYTRGTISITVNSTNTGGDHRIGGIFERLDGNTNIENSYSAMNIVSNCGSKTTGNNYVGGLAATGYTTSTSTYVFTVRNFVYLGTITITGTSPDRSYGPMIGQFAYAKSSNTSYTNYYAITISQSCSSCPTTATSVTAANAKSKTWYLNTLQFLETEYNYNFLSNSGTLYKGPVFNKTFEVTLTNDVFNGDTLNTSTLLGNEVVSRSRVKLNGLFIHRALTRTVSGLNTNVFANTTANVKYEVDTVENYTSQVDITVTRSQYTLSLTNLKYNLRHIDEKSVTGLINEIKKNVESSKAGTTCSTCTIEVLNISDINTGFKIIYINLVDSGTIVQSRKYQIEVVQESYTISISDSNFTITNTTTQQELVILILSRVKVYLNGVEVTDVQLEVTKIQPSLVGEYIIKLELYVKGINDSSAIMPINVNMN